MYKRQVYVQAVVALKILDCPNRAAVVAACYASVIIAQLGQPHLQHVDVRAGFAFGERAVGGREVLSAVNRRGKMCIRDRRMEDNNGLF